MYAAAIIPAGGIGARMGLESPKQFCNLAGEPILVHTVRAFEQLDEISLIIIAAPADHLDYTRKILKKHNLTKTKVVTGGKLRQDSVQAGLSQVPEECEFVAVHDGARPLVTPEIIRNCLARAATDGAAMAAIPVTDTIKKAHSDGLIIHTVDRDNLWQAQTPQVIRTSILKKAFAAASEQKFTGTDEASFLELIGEKMALVEGSEENIKITRPDDLLIAEALLMQKNKLQPPAAFPRIGHGYDAHRLVENRKLILGGIEIPHTKGLLGHSDADVLIHALCDAILGALAMGDIGSHFPDSDQAYKGISSLVLLNHVIELTHSKGYELHNADITVIAQQPKLAPHFPLMKEKLARCCKVKKSAINLKGTTTEKMGFTGREEGIAAHAVVLLQPV